MSFAAVMPSLRASRVPGRPVSAWATRPSRSRRAGVCRAGGRVSPGICSAKVPAGHSAARHLNRRIRTTITTGSPPNGASRSRRSYRPCIRPEGLPHRGHGAEPVGERLRSMTTPASRRTDSATTSARCGRTSRKPPEPHTHPKRSNGCNVTRPATEPFHPYAGGDVHVYADKRLGCLRRLAAPRRKDLRREPSPLAGLLVDPAVVHPRRPDLERPVGRPGDNARGDRQRARGVSLRGRGAWPGPGSAARRGRRRCRHARPSGA